MDLLEVLAEYNVNVFKNFSLPTLSFLETDMLFATLIAFYCLVCVVAIKFDAVKKRQENQEDDKQENQEDDKQENQEDDKQENQEDDKQENTEESVEL